MFRVVEQVGSDYNWLQLYSIPGQNQSQSLISNRLWFLVLNLFQLQAESYTIHHLKGTQQNEQSKSSHTSMPGAADSFLDVVDEDVIQQQTIVIPSVSPFNVQLTYVPKGPKRNINGTVDPTTVYIQNWMEIEGTPQQQNQYNVDYNTGLLTFNPRDAGTSLVVQYKTAGNLITASTVNTLQDATYVLEEFILHPYVIDSDLVKWYIHVDTSGTLSTSTTP